MEGKDSLTPYSQEQIAKGERLPEKLSSIRHEIETGEKLKLDYVIEQVAEASKAIKSKSDNRFVILGSMGMYTTLNELRENGQQLMLLEQRISGGKNDYDIGVHPEKLKQTMANFGWNEQTISLQRGRIENGNQMLDMMGRNELPHFPWQATTIQDQEVNVQAPEEMIFEKMSVLINPGNDENSETRMREIKWGVDIKLIKTYLMMKNGWSDTEVEAHLAKKWDEYIEDTRYQGVSGLVERVAGGESVGVVVIDALRKRLGKEEIVDAKQELLGVFGQGAENTIQSLLASTSDTEFSAHLKALIDIQTGSRLDYGEASQQATKEYSSLLQGQKVQKN